MPDEADPPRKFYGLKSREFERVNAPRADPEPDSAAAAPDPGPGSAPDERIELHDLIRAANTPGPALNRGPKVAAPTDVHAILQANAARAAAAGLDELTVKPKPRSRRARDYWLSLLLGNGVIIGLVLLLGPNIVTAMFGLGGVVIFSVTLTWIMWFLMDKY